MLEYEIDYRMQQEHRATPFYEKHACWKQIYTFG